MRLYAKMLFLTLCFILLVFEAESCDTSTFKNVRAIVSGKKKENPSDIVLTDCMELNPETAKYFTVEIMNHNIEKLNQGAFINLPVLTLVLSNNRIQQIEKGSFQNLRNMQTLDLTKNKLKALFQGVFTDLIGLKTLDLSQNQIEQIEDQTFAHMVSLKELKLNSNKIKVWNPNWFANNIAMDSLDITGNLVEVLPENSFPDMNDLRTLMLRENNLREIHENTFRGLKRLLTLDISVNRLTKLHKNTFAPFSGRVDNPNDGGIGAFRGIDPFSGLWYLYLHTNNLTYLSDQTLNDLSNTRSFSIFTFHSNPWQCGCYLKIVKWADDHRIRLDSGGKGCYRKDNPVCIVPKDKPQGCVENLEEDIRSVYFSRFKIPINNFFDRDVSCNMF